MKPDHKKPLAHGHTQTKAPVEAEEFLATSDLPERIDDTQVKEERQKRQGPPPAADRPPAATEENRYRPGDRVEEKPVGEDVERESDVIDEARVDEIQEASEESFPASDPPAWTGSTAGGGAGAQLDAPIQETPRKPATPRSVQKSRRREKDAKGNRNQ